MKEYEVYISGRFSQYELVAGENEEDAKINAMCMLGLQDAFDLKFEVIEIEEEPDNGKQ